MKLFVYGTLREGEPAHSLLRGAPLVARVTTEPAFTLVDMGEYPALVEAGESAVVGEVYAIDAELLPELDRYEDAPELYQRVSRVIAGHEVWVYVLPAAHARGRPAIASGDWRRR
jgi:gamma-glutamylcyclotransferase (GGCT)/AIG2-like uncharacterized protein YtfP